MAERVVSSSAEPILEPGLPIIDAHHHLWMLPPAALDAMQKTDTIAARLLAPTLRRRPRYLFDEFMEDVTSGHNIQASVFVDAETMYRTEGPQALRSVGEVEYVNGVAAMADSGLFGEIKLCAGIVGGVDLTLGDAVEGVLLAHIQAGGGRYRGVRHCALYDEDPSILGTGVPHLLKEASFRRGFAQLRRFNLSFDALVLEPQLPELIDLARSFCDTSIVLNHVGAPVGVGRYAGRRNERFSIWCERIHTLSRCPNVSVKLGGLGIPFGGFDSHSAIPPATSQVLAEEWRPYIETCIEAFGAQRCMFESNFPVDGAAACYPVLWNAFKRLAARASAEEKAALFSGTASRIYRIAGVSRV